jgi:hypothetical protein
MRGAWLLSLARTLLHEDTFELLVEPAIADLQADGSIHAYAPVWISLVYAWCVDFEGDVRLILDDAAMLATLIGIQAAYYSSVLLLLVTGKRGKDALAMFVNGEHPEYLIAIAAIVALSALPTLLCYWPPRRIHE